MTLAQTLILRGSRVLLGRWKTGAFAGRVTGPLGEYPGAPSPAAAATQAVAACADIRLDERLLSCRALFKFVELDSTHTAAASLGTAYEEFQFIYDADLANTLRDAYPELGIPELGEPYETDIYIPHWHCVDALPFPEMPEDDVEWYNRVIVDGEKLTGTFNFDGETLISHELVTVAEINDDIASTSASSAFKKINCFDNGLMLEALAAELAKRQVQAQVQTSGVSFRDCALLEDIIRSLSQCVDPEHDP